MAAELSQLPKLTGSSTLGSQLYDALEQAILDGTLAPGTRVHPDELAEHFGVSRIPIREALRALDASGWVEIRPRYGVYVRQRRPEEFEQLFEVRAPLEAQACRLAATHRTEQELAVLQTIVEQGASTTRSVRELATMNTDFHGAVAAASHNDVLIGILRGLRLRVQWYFAVAAPVRAHHSTEQHQGLVEAIAERDADRAAQLGEAHVLETLRVLRQEVSSVEPA